jgi:hypothetical protein
MNTERLIETLLHDVAPTAPLSRPSVRTAWWLLGTVAYLGALVLIMSSPADVVANGREWPSVFYQSAAILTAATAAYGAFASTIPGFPNRIVLLSTLAATVWVASLGVGAVEEWNRVGVDLYVPGEWACVAMIVLGGAFPALAMAIMLQQGAPLTPALTAGMGVLATGSLASVGACLSHPHASETVTLVWHGSTILALVALAASLSPHILTWTTRGDPRIDHDGSRHRDSDRPPRT